MPLQQLVVATVVLLASFCLATPKDGPIIKLNVDIHTNDGHHTHKSVELVGGEVLESSEENESVGKIN